MKAYSIEPGELTTYVDTLGTPYLANSQGRGRSYHVNYTFDF